MAKRKGSTATPERVARQQEEAAAIAAAQAGENGEAIQASTATAQAPAPQAAPQAAPQSAGKLDTAALLARYGKPQEGESLFDATAYESELQALRERHLGGLRGRIAEFDAIRRDIESELIDLNGTLARIEGRPLNATIRSSPGGSSGSTGGKRFRPSPEQLAEAAERIGGLDWSNGKEVGRAELASHLGIEWKNHIPKLIDAWNAKHSDRKIGTNGKQKPLTRYVMGK